MSASALARLSAAEAVFNAIRTDIESGKLAVGGKLSSEATLAQQYGVSRSVIREALRSCTALGLTVTKTGTGTFVVANKVANDLTWASTPPGTSPRPGRTSRSPQPASPPSGAPTRNWKPCADIVAAMTTENDPEAWVALDSSFHAAIARASHNKVFETWWPTSATPWRTSPKR